MLVNSEEVRLAPHNPISRYCLLLVSASIALHAAVIRGTVVENQTGKALSRAVVALQPIDGTPGKPLTVRTSRNGGFEFSSLAPGAYVVKVSRRGFMPAEYGQKRWNSAGVPVFLTEDASPFLTVRLPRYGGITGAVVDENDVGLPQHDVLVYRATQPPQLVTRTTSDDRGVYRIYGLEPGAYLIRSGAKQDEVTEYVPTFARETLRVEESRPVPVYLEEDSKNVDVRPLSAKLFTVAGAAIPSAPGAGPVSVTLASDIGRQTTVGPPFSFGSLPAGQYELYAEVPENPSLRASFQAAYLLLNVPAPPLDLSLQPVRETRFEFSPAIPGDSSAIQIMARRKDLAGVHQQQALRLTNDRAMLGPGRWELLLTPPSGFYVSGFLGPWRGSGVRGRPDGWNEITVRENNTSVRFSLSSGPAALHGVVKAGADPVAGAPVYLEGYDVGTRQRATDLRTTRTDMRGVYRFEGLAPGTYRVLATFEYQMPDSAAMDLGGARPLKAEANSNLQMDLDLYVVR